MKGRGTWEGGSVSVGWQPGLYRRGQAGGSEHNYWQAHRARGEGAAAGQGAGKTESLQTKGSECQTLSCGHRMLPKELELAGLIC